jgi:hypothetical protein
MKEPETAILGLIQRAAAPRVAVAAGDVGAPRSVLVEPDSVFHAASTMKVAVLVELYRNAWADGVSLDAPVVVHNAFQSWRMGLRTRSTRPTIPRRRSTPARGLRCLSANWPA